MCDGLCAVDVVPSPKVHNQLEGAPVDVSVNCTANGALPDVGIAVNEAAGAAGETAIDWDAEVLLPPVFVAVNVTEYEPAVA